jgi:hypothetical protein
MSPFAGNRAKAVKEVPILQIFLVTHQRARYTKAPDAVLTSASGRACPSLAATNTLLPPRKKVSSLAGEHERLTLPLKEQPESIVPKKNVEEVPVIT